MKRVRVICVYVMTSFNHRDLSLLLVRFSSFNDIFYMFIAYQLIGARVNHFNLEHLLLTMYPELLQSPHMLIDWHIP
jgi:hypothetical protein